MGNMHETLQDAIENRFEPYALALGRVAHSWNRLQEGLGVIFCDVTGLSHKVGFAIWYSTTNDRAQREMLKKAVEATFDNEDERSGTLRKQDIMWLLNKVNGIAEQRNNAIHAPCSLAFVEIPNTL